MKKEDGYFRFIFRKPQLVDWIVIAVVVTLGCLINTIWYPYPRTMGDSFGYLWSAIRDEFTYLRPFGYSFYLQLVHVFSDSLYSVIVSQALIYTLSLGLFLLAVKKFWPPMKRWRFVVFEAVAALSPSAIFMLNTILSDTLQCSLVFLMIAMVIVMIKEESWLAMGIYVLALFASFNTRYTSEFFPLAFIPVLALKGKRIFRIVSIALTVVAFALFYVQRTNNMEETSGQKQFSTGFEGWQLASNAIHMIPFLDEEEKANMPKDKDLRELHQFVTGFEKAHGKIASSTKNGKEATASFIWEYDSPLKQYFFRKVGDNNYGNEWIVIGTKLFKKYGKWLILSHPGSFIKYYLIPNTKQAFFTTRNEVVFGDENVPAGKAEVVEWFDVPKDLALTPRGQGLGNTLKPVLPWIELATWLIMLASVVVMFASGKKVKFPRDTKLVLWVLFLFGVIYYGAVTFASPIALRYWMPMHAVKLVFAWIAVNETLRIRASQAL